MSQLGPPANFRCNEFGHLCDDGSGNFIHPNRNAPGNDVAATVMYPACRSNDTEGYLLGVVDTAQPDQEPEGRPEPGHRRGDHRSRDAVHRRLEGAEHDRHLVRRGLLPVAGQIRALLHRASDGSFADPSVRIVEFVNQFGANGLVLPICSDNFGPSLDRIAMLINAQLQPPCITQKVAMKPGTQEPDCTVVSHTSNSLGGFNDSTVPWCGSGAAAPCWQLTPGGMGAAAASSPCRPDPNVRDVDDAERDGQLLALRSDVPGREPRLLVRSRE